MMRWTLKSKHAQNYKLREEIRQENPLRIEKREIRLYKEWRGMKHQGKRNDKQDLKQ